MPDEQSTPPNHWARRHLWHIQPVRDLLLVGIVVSVVWVGYTLRYVTIPLIVALGLAYLVEPIVHALSRRFKVSRTTVVGGVTTAIVLAAFGTALVLVPSMIRQTEAIVEKVESGALKRSVVELKEQLPESLRNDAASWIKWFEAATEIDIDGDRRAGDAVEPSDAVDSTELESRPPRSIWNIGISFVGARSGDIAGFAFGILSLLFAAALVPFYFWFFSVHFRDIVAFMDGLVPESSKPEVHALAGQMNAAVSGFVRGRVVIAAIMGMLCAVGWMLCGVPYALTLGVAAGALAIVPYLSGALLLLVVPMLVLAQMQLPEAERMSGLWMVAGPTIVFGIVTALDGNLLTPIIAGRATNLDPVTVFVAILAGGSIAGVYGMLLAIPFAACAKILLREVALPRARAWAAGAVPDPLPLDDE